MLNMLLFAQKPFGVSCLTQNFNNKVCPATLAVSYLPLGRIDLYVQVFCGIMQGLHQMSHPMISGFILQSAASVIQSCQQNGQT